MFSGACQIFPIVSAKLLLLTIFTQGQVSIFMPYVLVSEFQWDDYRCFQEGIPEDGTFETVSTLAFYAFFKSYNVTSPFPPWNEYPLGESGDYRSPSWSGTS